MADAVLPAAPLRLVRGGVLRVVACLLLLVVVGDWLCFDQVLGAGVAVLAVCIIAAAYAAQAKRPVLVRLGAAAMLAALAQMPWLLAPDALAFSLLLLGTGVAAALLKGGALWPQSLGILSGIGWRMAPDLVRAWRKRASLPAGQIGAAQLLGWLLPALGGAVFLGLFADANPIIATGLDAASPVALLRALSAPHVLFWLALAALAWPFLMPPKALVLRLSLPAAPWGGASALLFGIAPIRRALVLFNMLFALQTGLDAAYLWAGAKLPAGLSYADYAHRGAYPLIATALLAGGFAILATRPGSAPAASRGIRWLVLVWVAQTLALVGASIFRLYLYVQVYSLSELRLASFIWMLLVFAGLVLIILRILLARDDAWLLRANAIAALATIYIAACLNFPWIVAQYDVTHCREVTGAGAMLDVDYLQSLGPQAIPALDRYQVLTANAEAAPFAQQGPAGVARVMLAEGFGAMPADWRGFSVWSWVLRCYLVTHEPKHAGG